MIWDDCVEALRETQLQQLVREDGEILLRLRLAGQGDLEEVLQFTPCSRDESSMRPPLQEKALGSGRATAVHGTNSVFSWATEDQGGGEVESMEKSRVSCSADVGAAEIVYRDTDCSRPLFRTRTCSQTSLHRTPSNTYQHVKLHVIRHGRACKRRKT